MNFRYDYSSQAPEAVRPLFEASKALSKSGLDETLLALVNIRASQMNGCAFCLSLHAREAEALGVSLDRLNGIPAWREASWYSDRERAALELTEALTKLDGKPLEDEIYARVKAQFTEHEIAHLALAISSINAWNRFNVLFRTPPEYAEQTFKRLHPAAAKNGAV
jgi:AhpD family alkylhydroperoxidase